MSTPVAVYGKESIEKNLLMKKLISSKTFKYLTSTPANRFSIIDNGIDTPFNLAPFQILFIDLDMETRESLDALNLKRSYRLCDFQDRPLMFIVKGAKNHPLLNELKKHANDNVIFELSLSLETLSEENISQKLQSLGQGFYPQESFSL
ncbi:MAG: hypothetical protein H0U70_06925 [Tatlockia sp.]|nr:hypothetical protein [Tatlockia sp.]